MIVVSPTQHLLTRHAAQALDLLAAYWTSLAMQDRDIPVWSRIDPCDIQDALDHAFLAERHGMCHTRLRVAGQGVSDITGSACQGLPISLWFRSGDRVDLNRALAECIQTRRPIALELSTGAGSVLAARMVLYPLRDTSGRVAQFLGGLAPVTEDATPVRGPFGLIGMETRVLATLRPALRLVVNNT